MNIKSNEFPQYRKHLNGKHLYKILDERHFEELQLLGSKVLLHRFEAKKYPEIIRILDMLKNEMLYLPAEVKVWEEWFTLTK